MESAISFKCLCGSANIVMMECAQCHQPANGCANCLRRLSPCRCEKGAVGAATEITKCRCGKCWRCLLSHSCEDMASGVEVKQVPTNWNLEGQYSAKPVTNGLTEEVRVDSLGTDFAPKINDIGTPQWPITNGFIAIQEETSRTDRIASIEEELATMKANLKECLSKNDGAPSQGEVETVHESCDSQLKSLKTQLAALIERNDSVSATGTATQSCLGKANVYYGSEPRGSEQMTTKSSEQMTTKSVDVVSLASTDVMEPAKDLTPSRRSRKSRIKRAISEKFKNRCHDPKHPSDLRMKQRLEISMDQNRELIDNLAKMRVKLAIVKDNKKRGKKSRNRRRSSLPRQSLDSCPELERVEYDDMKCETYVCDSR